MSDKIVAQQMLVNKKLTTMTRQPLLSAFLSQQVDACLWLTENTTDPIVATFARVALRRLEAQILASGEPAT